MPETLPSTDESLYVRFQGESSEPALGDLLARHWPGCYRLALALVRDPSGAEDVAQEAFVRLVNLARAGRTVESVKGWLMTAVVNACRNHLRARRRRTRHELSSVHVRGMAGPEDPSAVVGEYVESLPEEVRLPLVLHYGLGYTHQEVALALGCPQGSISARIRDGLEGVRRSLAPESALTSLEAALTVALAPEGAAAVPSPASSLARAGGASPLATPAALARRLATPAALGAVALAALGVALTAFSSEGGEASRPPVTSTSRPASFGSEDPAPPGTHASPPALEAPSLAHSAPENSAKPMAVAAAGSATAAASLATTRSAFVGRVIDERGVPVAGAMVLLVYGPRRNARDEEPSDDDRLELLEDHLTPRDEDAVLGCCATEIDGCFALVPAHPLPECDGEGARARSEAPRPAGVISAKEIPDRVLTIIAKSTDEESKGEKVLHELAPGPVGDVSVKTLACLAVSVRFAGQPVSEALVTIDDRSLRSLVLFGEGEIPSGTALVHPMTRNTDEAGLARYPTRARAVRVAVAREGFATDRRLVRLDGKDALLEVDLQAGCSVAGVVVDGEGAPVESATVVAAEGKGLAAARTTTDARGAFELRSLAAGHSYEVVAHEDAPSFADACAEVAAPNPALRLTLWTAGRAVVKVTRRTGEHDAGLVQLQREETSGWRTIESGPGFEVENGEADYRSTFTRLAPGRYRACCSLPHALNAAPGVSEPFMVVGGQEVGATVLLAEGRILTGRVLDAGGSPVLGAVVSAEPFLEGLLATRSTTSSEGRFYLSSMPRGPVTLLVKRGASSSPFSVQVSVPGDDAGDIVIPH